MGYAGIVWISSGGYYGCGFNAYKMKRGVKEMHRTLSSAAEKRSIFSRQNMRSEQTAHLATLGLLGLLLVASCDALPMQGRTPIPVVIDTDIGTDIDDSFAVAMALHYDQSLIDIKMILTASHNTPSRGQILAKFLTSVGRDDIPIGIGVQQDSEWVQMSNWTRSDVDYLAQYRGPVFLDGVSALYALSLSTPNLTVLELAPAGNIAALLGAHPDASRTMNIVAMGGSIAVGYHNSSTPAAEWNIADNVDAARKMYSAQWREPILTTPLDTCGLMYLFDDDVRDLLRTSSPAFTVAFEQWVFWLNINNNFHEYNPIRSMRTLFDPVAVYLLLNVSREMVDIQPMHIQITDDGHTIPMGSDRITSAGGAYPLVYEAVAWKNVHHFRKWLVTHMGDQ